MSGMGSLGKQLNNESGFESLGVNTNKVSILEELEEGSEDLELFKRIEARAKEENLKETKSKKFSTFNTSSGDEEELDKKVENDIELEMTKDREAYLKSIYPKDSVDIAIDFHDNISEILMGKTNSFVYEFDEKENNFKGLNFSIRSLTCGEDNEMSRKFRSLGWDSNPTNISEHLIMNEKLNYSLMSYCSTDLSKKKIEFRRNYISKIPSAIIRVILDKLAIFNLSMNIISSGDEHIKLVKKCFARQ